MAEVAQLKFDLREIGEMLLEKQGIRSGKWQVGFGFNIAGVESGPTPEQIRPGALLTIEHLLLTAVPNNGPMVIDLDAKRTDSDTKGMTRVK